ncbi:MAG TPA: redoxin domain-containing protein [Solirubrobacteraceae bacterium]
MIEPGTAVPDFTLRREDGSEFTAADLDGQRTVLVFYPFAFSPVCTDQLNLYDDVLEEFAAQGATLRAVSCDASPSQIAFREQLGVSIEQLSDFEPKGAVCRAFGIYHEAGMAERALILVGPDRIVEWSWVGENPGVLPGANLIFDALASPPAA